MNYELNSISLWNGFCSSCCWMLIMIPSGFSFCISHGDDVPCLLVDGHLAKITRVDLFFIFQQWWKISKLDLRTIGNLFEVMKKIKTIYFSMQKKSDKKVLHLKATKQNVTLLAIFNYCEQSGLEEEDVRYWCSWKMIFCLCSIIKLFSSPEWIFHQNFLTTFLTRGGIFDASWCVNYQLLSVAHYQSSSV